MKDYIFTLLKDSPNYLGVITLLNYETDIETILVSFNNLSLSNLDKESNNEKKLILDLGYKVGFNNNFRFMIISLNKDNKVDIKKLSSSNYLNTYKYLSLLDLSNSDKYLLVKINDIAKSNKDNTNSVLFRF